MVGGQSVHNLYGFVWSPIALNVLMILTVAVAFNRLFKWRKYPAYRNRQQKQPASSEEISLPVISHDEVVAALRRLDSFVDVTEDDLIRLYQIISTNHALMLQGASKNTEDAGDTRI